MPDEVVIRAVLDASAMLSYSRGHVHVGELLLDISEEGAYVGLPTVALLDAYAQTGADRLTKARLKVLATLPGVAVLSLGAADAVEVANTVRLVKGDLARAHAVWTALDHDAYYLTSEPHLVPDVIAPELVHHIPVDDV
ncbi:MULTISPECIES: hypothetical protein [Micromonospora]|uniref:PIN domain-containing protein n=1 Tax=Micromonospora yangpuensis TaxID=683228 RepID=A0A1C6TWW5_9ACTN|nr:hypothetical protein [Micromonospora yangpuensis]GGM01406.1 hypothetical protein GCM10012279_18720 [Micromonospora yangpuensis]SCL46178.1 hypothetical protein GA0070617_0175 [Micromonospora yangpuensis]